MLPREWMGGLVMDDDNWRKVEIVVEAKIPSVNNPDYIGEGEFEMGLKARMEEYGGKDVYVRTKQKRIRSPF